MLLHTVVMQMFMNFSEQHSTSAFRVRMSGVMSDGVISHYLLSGQKILGALHRSAYTFKAWYFSQHKGKFDFSLENIRS